MLEVGMLSDLDDHTRAVGLVEQAPEGVALERRLRNADGEVERLRK
jgi:hypothetical protein